MAHFIIWNSFRSGQQFIRSVGPHALASWLARFGYVIKVIDFSSNMSTQNLVDITEKYIDSSTIGVGVSNTFMTIRSQISEEPAWVVNARSQLEPKHPKLEWIIGGNGWIIKPFVMKWRMFFGHAEDTFLKYLDEKTNVTTPRQKFDIQTFDTHYLDNLGLDKNEVLPLQLGRGCQFKCSFCQFPLIGKKKGTYIRDYSLVEAEFRSNYDRYGTTRYIITDDTANESEEKIIALADIVQRLPFKLEWVGYNRLDLIGVKPYTMQVLKDSGLRSAFFGIESFDLQASKSVGKGWNGKHAKEFLLKLRDEWKGEINWHLSFIAGLNNETGENSYNDHIWCIKNKMYSWEFSPLYINATNPYMWKSEFERNHLEHGFTFPNKEQPGLWHSKTWNYNEAEKHATILTTAADAYCKTTTWHLAEFASVGHSFDELMPRFMDEYNKPLHQNKVKSLVDSYIQYQLK